MDSDDVLGILRDAGGTTDAKLARSWQWTISLWKNQGLTSDGAARAAADDDERSRRESCSATKSVCRPIRQSTSMT